MCVRYRERGVSVCLRLHKCVFIYLQVSVCEICIYGVCECKDVSFCFHLVLTSGARGTTQSYGNLFLKTNPQKSFLPMPRPLLCRLHSTQGLKMGQKIPREFFSVADKSQQKEIPRPSPALPPPHPLPPNSYSPSGRRYQPLPPPEDSAHPVHIYPAPRFTSL